jgi:hypothetical protein
MNLKKSAKGRLIPVVILCIVIASTGFLCFFHDPSQKGQYCNHILHWKKCDGQLVRIFGKVPGFSFKTSGLFLMYDTFPRRRNEFKRETEKF